MTEVHGLAAAAGKVQGAFKRLHIPKAYTILKWAFLLIIAISTALVGFFQSMLVSWLYELRSMFIYALVQTEGDWKMKFLQYTAFNLLLAFSSSMSLFIISPAASGSGIPDVKAFLNGVESPIFKNFFTIKTFVAKVIASALAVSSSLIMGKEGPMLHAGSILAVSLGSNKWMQQQMEIASHWGVYTYNKEIRDLVAIGVACGVTTAFKAPVGGVMFAMEMSTRWRQELTVRCFLACAITIVVVRTCVTTCVAHGQCANLKWGSLIWFSQNYPTPYYQTWAIVILGVLGGYLGCLWVSFNTWVCIVRKKWTKFMWARIAEVCAISVATSIIFYFLPIAGECKSCDSKDPLHCISGGALFRTFTGYRCHAALHYNDLAVLVFNPQGFVTQALFTAHSGTFSMPTLALYSIFFWLMAAITYGAFIPSGVFTPSLIFGGCFGRLFAEVLVHMGVAGETEVGMYALLGAASFLGGMMRMSAAQALILMEMTQSPGQLPFLMLVLVLSKNVGDRFNYSVFDQQMMLKGLAFVGINESAVSRAHLNAGDVMTANGGGNSSGSGAGSTLYLTESGPTLAQALDEYRNLAAFPVTTFPPDTGDKNSKGNFVGMISRRNVADLLDLHGRDADAIDLSSKVEVAPVVIPPNMPLPFIYRIVNAEGFNYVPVIRYHGVLEGVVSRQDLVDVQNKRLDEFHLKDQIERMADEINQGKIIGSMQLGNNIHAQAFKRVLQNPLAAAKELLEKEDAPTSTANTEGGTGAGSGFFLTADETAHAREGGGRAAALHGGRSAGGSGRYSAGGSGRASGRSTMNGGGEDGDSQGLPPGGNSTPTGRGGYSPAGGQLPRGRQFGHLGVYGGPDGGGVMRLNLMSGQLEAGVGTESESTALLHNGGGVMGLGGTPAANARLAALQQQQGLPGSAAAMAGDGLGPASTGGLQYVQVHDPATASSVGASTLGANSTGLVSYSILPADSTALEEVGRVLGVGRGTLAEEESELASLTRRQPGSS